MSAGSAQVVILGAGRSVRGALPSVMVDIDEHGRVMDWLLDAFAVLERADISFVGGYRAEDVVERYPQLRVVFNREWALKETEKEDILRRIRRLSGDGRTRAEMSQSESPI